MSKEKKQVKGEEPSTASKRALKILRKHFAEITTKQFIRNVKKYCPELLENERLGNEAP